MQKTLIPFDEDDNLIMDPDNYDEEDITWKQNYKFEDTMELIFLDRRQRSVNMIVESTTGATYNIFIKDLENMLKKCDVLKGKVSSKWHFVKKGRNYGLTISE